MRRVVLMALLALALPVVAFASGNVDFANVGGTLTGTNGSLSLAGSTLIGVNNLNGLGLVTGNLGSVSFTTPVISDLQNGGTFGAGGTFVITGNGTGGIPNGVIFSGTFTSGTWALVTLPDSTHNYVLTGVLSGTLGSSFTTTGVTVQLTINTGKGFFNGSTTLSSGDTSIVVPEPGTLGLLGTGLVGIAGLIRRRIKIG